MKEPAEQKVKPVLAIALCILIIAIVTQGIFSSCSVKTSGSAKNYRVYATPDTATADQAVTVQATTAQPVTEESTQKQTTEPETEPTEATEKETKAQETTEPTTQAETVQWATVMTLPTKCSLEEQWENGYIVAIDYPDKTYQTFHIELTEEDRDVLEHLCMGEFGTGGFIGAALIAQCVKDAMCFDGYKTVEDVRVKCRYDASLDNTPTQEVKDAVAYIFDYDQAAVQHRMMYMYNPNLVTSAFHESQNYILTYGDVRFFDRWGY